MPYCVVSFDFEKLVAAFIQLNISEVRLRGGGGGGGGGGVLG